MKNTIYAVSLIVLIFLVIQLPTVAARHWHERAHYLAGTSSYVDSASSSALMHSPSLSSTLTHSRGTTGVTEGVIYWRADFEEGSGVDWTRDYGGWEVTQGRGTITYVTTPSWRGQYVMRNWTPSALVTRRAKCARGLEPETLTELYYGGAVYIPDDFVPDPYWCQLASLSDPFRNEAFDPLKGDRYADINLKVEESTQTITTAFYMTNQQVLAGMSGCFT
jgi:hypothetical protein